MMSVLSAPVSIRVDEPDACSYLTECPGFVFLSMKPFYFGFITSSAAKNKLHEVVPDQPARAAAVTEAKEGNSEV